MEDLVGDVPEPVMSPPTAEKASGGCFGSPAAETRTLVQVAEEPENPVDRSKQLENPGLGDESKQKLMHSVLLQSPEVKDETNPVLGVTMDSAHGEPVQTSVSEPDHALMKLPRYQCEALYVADLHPSVIDNADLLYELFSQVGKLASGIRVMPHPRPAETAGKLPLWSAYVNFFTVEDACRAWQTLNYHVWMGIPIRIMFSNLDPTTRYNQKANIIVTDLEESIDSQVLHRNFCEFGVVLSCKVDLDPIGRSTGRGYIQFQDEEEAQRAIEKMNNRTLRGKRVYVGPFVRRTNHWEPGNKNPTDLNPAHSSQLEGLGNIQSHVENTDAHPINDEPVYESHVNLFGSSPGSGSHSIQFGSFEAVLIPMSSLAAPSSTSNTQGFEEDNPSKERQRKRKTKAQRKRARNEFMCEKRSNEQLVLEKIPTVSQHFEAPRQSSVPTVPWPPQPWSVEMLKAKLAEADCPEDREAMLGATLSFFVSKQTKHFHSEVTNELKKLDIDEIERIMVSEDDLLAKVDEVKRVICNRINSQAPFVPAPKTSSAPAEADDPAAIFEVPAVPDFGVPDFAVSDYVFLNHVVPVVPEFLDALALPSLDWGILPIPERNPPAVFQSAQGGYFPQIVLNYTSYRRGTGFYDVSDVQDELVESIRKALYEGNEYELGIPDEYSSEQQ